MTEAEKGSGLKVSMQSAPLGAFLPCLLLPASCLLYLISFFSTIICTPTLPSTSCVMRRSAAMLAS